MAGVEICVESPSSPALTRACRICLGEEGVIVAMRCNCKSAYVHDECMLRWTNFRRELRGEHIALRCEVCMQVHPAHLRRRPHNRALSEFLLCTTNIYAIWSVCLAAVVTLTASLAGFAVTNRATLGFNYSITPTMTAAAFVVMGLLDGMLVMIILFNSNIIMIMIFNINITIIIP